MTDIATPATQALPSGAWSPTPPGDASFHGRMRDALQLCRRHLIAAAAFSALVNLLYIAPTLYMLQVYDRVVPTKGLQTLGFLTAALLFALGCLALLDRIRSRLLVRAGVLLDAVVAQENVDAGKTPGSSLLV